MIYQLGRSGLCSAVCLCLLGPHAREFSSFFTNLPQDNKVNSKEKRLAGDSGLSPPGSALRVCRQSRVAGRSAGQTVQPELGEEQQTTSSVSSSQCCVLFCCSGNPRGLCAVWTSTQPPATPRGGEWRAHGARPCVALLRCNRTCYAPRRYGELTAGWKFKTPTCYPCLPISLISEVP